MNKELVREIKSSPWLMPDSCKFMLFATDTPSWLIVERILLNVSISFERNWKEVWTATEAHEESYKALVISLLLIDRNLARISFMSTKNRRSIMGERNWLILQEYEAHA